MPAAPADDAPPRSQLALRRVAIDTWRENVAYLHRDCAVYRAEGFQALSKIEVRANGLRILATVNVVDDSAIVGCHELGLSEDAFAQLGVEPGYKVAVAQAEPPESMGALFRKIAGERLGRADFRAIVRDIADHRYSKIELTAFVVACNRDELDREEVYFLSDAMVQTGQRLDWHAPQVVDKHCIGGIPGNRTSMLVVPIVAAYGMLCPKTSSRAITSPAGTADTMEVLAHVELPLEQLQAIVRDHYGCLAWGGTAQLSPADDVLISVERPLSIDSPGQMVASILSKKIAAGSNHVVLDIPVGPTAKVRTEDAAHRLGDRLTAVAARFGLAATCIRTDGNQPVGRGIGPALEAHDILAVLQNKSDAPADLRHRAAVLAGAALEIGGAAEPGAGYALALATLADGQAWTKFQRICQAQGGMREPPKALHIRPLTAARAGRIVQINNRKIAQLAKLAGAPEAKAAGVTMEVMLGADVGIGQPLLQLHADTAGELAYAMEYACRNPDIIEIAT